MDLLNELWNLADEFAGSDDNALFGECGLFLQRPLSRWDYFCTPLNTLTFASTGGDGVHYGLLLGSDTPYDQLPVVMTVPMSDQYNTVVAETLGEFLGLGYFVGWFSLEQLAYEPRWATEYYNQPDPEAWPECESELSLIRERLCISHVPLVLSRVQYLNETYGSLLLLPADDAPGS